MDIKEIKEKRQVLRTKLISLIDEFEKETGACVKEVFIRHEGISFTSINDCTNPIVVHMKVEV